MTSGREEPKIELESEGKNLMGGSAPKSAWQTGEANPDTKEPYGRMNSERGRAQAQGVRV
jgi:hypothetical protein